MTHKDNISEVSIVDTNQNTNLDTLESTEIDSEVLLSLLEKMSPLDFYTLANLSSGQKIIRRHQVVYTIDEILKLTASLNYGLAMINGNLSIYNGKYWSKLENSQVKEFLGKASEKFGVERSVAQYYSFKEELFKQLVSSGFKEKVKHGNNTKINFRNGTLHFDSDGTIEHKNFNVDDLMTYVLPFDYDPYATCPQFDSYINRVLPDNAQQQILAEFIAYSFLPSALFKLEKALILYGSGANGKSVFFDIIRKLIGEENVSHYTLSSLTSESGYHRAKIAFKLLNYASEISPRMDSSVFKALVSGEPIECRLPYQEPFIMSQYAKLVFNCNELPSEVENTYGFYRRFLLIEFAQTIPEEERDPELAGKIVSSELPGILNWVLEGVKRLIENRKFTQSLISEKALERYKLENDSFLLFLEEGGYSPGQNDNISLKDFFEQYKNYCSDSGFKFCSNRIFSNRLKKQGFSLERKNYGNVVNFSRNIMT